MIVVRGLGNVANTVDVVSLSTSTLSVTLEFVSLIPCVRLQNHVETQDTLYSHAWRHIPRPVLPARMASRG